MVEDGRGHGTHVFVTFPKGGEEALLLGFIGLLPEDVERDRGCGRERTHLRLGQRTPGVGVMRQEDLAGRTGVERHDHTHHERADDYMARFCDGNHGAKGSVPDVEAGGFTGLVAQLLQDGLDKLDEVQAQGAGRSQRTMPMPMRYRSPSRSRKPSRTMFWTSRWQVLEGSPVRRMICWRVGSGSATEKQFKISATLWSTKRGEEFVPCSDAT